MANNKKLYTSPDPAVTLRDMTEVHGMVIRTMQTALAENGILVLDPEDKTKLIPNPIIQQMMKMQNLIIGTMLHYKMITATEEKVVIDGKQQIKTKWEMVRLYEPPSEGNPHEDHIQKKD